MNRYLQFIFLGLIFWLSLGPAVLAEDDSLEKEKIISKVAQNALPATVGITAELDNGQLKRGSGVIVDGRRGQILTNQHVIKDAQKIEIILNNGQTIKAALIKDEPKYDLALLQVTVNFSLPEIFITDSDNLRKDELVIAIGNPSGLSGTVTSGTVLNSKKSLPHPSGVSIRNMILHNAAINRGNSGGALLNVNGELVGINTLASQEYEWGASVSSATVKDFLGHHFDSSLYISPRSQVKLPPPEDSEEKPYTPPPPKPAARPAKTLVEIRPPASAVPEVAPYLGLELKEISPDEAAENGIYTVSCCMISQVLPNSPASEIGLRSGDIILTINDERIASVEDYQKTLASSVVGGTLWIEFWQNREAKTCQIIVAGQ